MEDASKASSGAGSTGPISIPFYFLDATHIRAVKLSGGVEPELVLTTDFSLTGEGDESGGALTLVAALAVGETLTIVRSVPLTQETNWPVADPFPARSHEQAADKLTMLLQQIAEEQDRSLAFPVSDDSPTNTLPVAADRASKAMGFDASGNPFMIDPASAVTASENVTFLQSGSAEPTTSEKKHQERVTFDDFLTAAQRTDAVTGSPTVDMTAKMQAALDSGAKVVEGVQGRTYLVSQVGTKTFRSAAHRYCLLVPDGVVVDLKGATVKLADAANAAIFMNSTAGTTQNTDLGVENGVLDGNETNQTSPAAGDMACLHFYDVLRPRFDNLRV
jgi:hypothetical protein